MHDEFETTKPPECIRAALVDDQPVCRLGLRTLIDREPSLAVAAEASSLEQALAVAAEVDFDVAIVSLLSPMALGMTFSSALRRLQPSCRILGLSDVDAPLRIAEVIRAGASGFALKSQPAEELVEAVCTVATGRRYLPPTVPAQQIDDLLADAGAWPLDRLTHREREVFELLVLGHSNDRVASQLFIARRTVETHRQHITRKLQVHSIVELVRLAVHHGITRP